MNMQRNLLFLERVQIWVIVQLLLTMGNDVMLPLTCSLLLLLLLLFFLLIYVSLYLLNICERIISMLSFMFFVLLSFVSHFLMNEIHEEREGICVIGIFKNCVWNHFPRERYSTILGIGIVCLFCWQQQQYHQYHHHQHHYNLFFNIFSIILLIVEECSISKKRTRKTQNWTISKFITRSFQG
jgi:Ca2+/Na+ antiporter